MDSPPDPTVEDPTTVSLSHFAEELGVTVAAVTNWRARFPDFPAAVDPTEAQLSYRRDELLEWARDHSRISPGRLVAPRLRNRYSPVERLAHLAWQAASPDLVPDGPGPSRDRRQLRTTAADRALAVAALGLLRRRGLDDETFGDLVRACDELRAVSDGDTVDAALAALNEQVDALPADDPTALAQLVDALRGDHMFLVGRPAVTTQALWQLVGPLHEGADTIVDPVCGDGGLLAEAARFRRQDGRTVRLVGQDLDPVRVATARALLEVEGFAHELHVGDSSDAEQVRARLPHGDRTLLVADLPLRVLDRRDRVLRPEHWIRVVREWLADDAQARAAIVVRTPWLSRATRSPLGDAAGLLEVGALRAVVVGHSTGPNTVPGESVVLLGPPTRPHPDVLMVNLAADTGRTREEVDAETRQAIVTWQRGDRVDVDPIAVVRSAAEISAAGTLAPPSYVQVSPAEVERLHRRAAKPVADRTSPPALTQPADAVAGDGPPDPPRVPVAAMRVMQDVLGRAVTSPPVAIPAGDADLGDLVRGFGDTPMLVILGANQLVGETDDRRGGASLVTLVTSTSEFGNVELHRGARIGETALRRGLVGFRITQEGRSIGLSPEFLAGWLSSVVVQQRLRKIVREGKTRHTSSLDDLRSLPLPAKFPDPDVLSRIAAQWTAFEAVRAFAAELPETLAYWQLHLADEPPPDD